MQTNLIETGKWERDLEVEIPAERMAKEMSSALRTHQKRLEIPGFRKGKVPLNLIEKRYGAAIRSGVIEDLLPRLLQEATQEAGLNPAGTPRITKLDHEPGEALSFTASLDIWPEVELDNTDGLELSRVVHEITDDELDEQLTELRNRQATEKSVERALEKGDVLIADLQRLDDKGEPVEGDRFEERYFHVGNAEAPSPEFEESLVGIEAGEERTIDFTYRDDLPNEELAGKEEHFLVTAREVRDRTLPELDDEFAKDVGEQFENLDQLKDHIRQQMTQRWEFMARQQMRGEIMDGLLERHEIEFPEGLINNYLESLRQEREAQGQGQDHDHDHDDHDHDHDHDHDDHDHDHDASKFTDEERQSGERRLKSYLLMEALRSKLTVEVTDEEFDTYLEGRATEMGLSADDLKRSPRVNDLRRDLEEDKIFEQLQTTANITEKKV